MRRDCTDFAGLPPAQLSRTNGLRGLAKLLANASSNPSRAEVQRPTLRAVARGGLPGRGMAVLLGIEARDRGAE